MPLVLANRRLYLYVDTPWGIRLAFAADEQGRGDEEGGAGSAEEVDGVAIGGLYGGGSGAGAVEALGAALGVGRAGE